MYLSLYGVLWNLGIQYKWSKSSDSLPEGMFKEVMNDLWLARISQNSREKNFVCCYFTFAFLFYNV
jgi:hypothetical protein